jgi:hypothetical protein
VEDFLMALKFLRHRINPMNRFIAPKLILYLLAGSVGGLLLCRLIDTLFFRDGNHLDQTVIGLWILRFLAIVFGGTVLILVPLRIILNRSQIKDVRQLWAEGKIDPEQMHPFWKHLFYMNYGEVPKWVYLPFAILATILAGIFALGIIAFIVLALLWLVLRLYIFISHLLGH